jgi:hypothetical protein
LKFAGLPNPVFYTNYGLLYLSMALHNVEMYIYLALPQTTVFAQPSSVSMNEFLSKKPLSHLSTKTG